MFNIYEETLLPLTEAAAHVPALRTHPRYSDGFSAAFVGFGWKPCSSVASVTPAQSARSVLPRHQCAA